MRKTLLVLVGFGFLVGGGFGMSLADPTPVHAVELGTVVCPATEASLDPGDLLPYEQPTVFMLECEDPQKPCCPACNACCNPGYPDYEMCCSECYPAYCAEQCCDDGFY